jgi:chromate transporter
LSYLAVAHIDIPAVAAAFYGIQPVVVAVVIEAVLRIGKKALKHHVLYGFAALAFMAIFFSRCRFPISSPVPRWAACFCSPPAPGVLQGQFDPRLGNAASRRNPDRAGRAKPSWVMWCVFLHLLVLWAVVVGGVWIWRGTATP